MNKESLLCKRTWVGLGAAVMILLLSVMVCALVIVKGILPQLVTAPWIWGSYAAAAFLGGMIAGKGQGRRLCSLLPGAALYVLIWMLALSSQREIGFRADGIGITAAILLGAGIAYISTGTRRRRKPHQIRKRPVSHKARR